jgi:hypothetical protein
LSTCRNNNSKRQKTTGQQLRGFVNANIQAVGTGDQKLLTIVLTWFAGRQTVPFRKKKQVEPAWQLWKHKGTTVSLNAGWFMLLARCPPLS